MLKKYSASFFLTISLALLSQRSAVCSFYRLFSTKMVTEVFAAFLTLPSSDSLFDFVVQSRKHVAAGNPHPSAQALTKSQGERIGD